MIIDYFLVYIYFFVYSSSRGLSLSMRKASAVTDDRRSTLSIVQPFFFFFTTNHDPLYRRHNTAYSVYGLCYTIQQSLAAVSLSSSSIARFAAATIARRFMPSPGRHSGLVTTIIVLIVIFAVPPLQRPFVATRTRETESVPKPTKMANPKVFFEMTVDGKPAGKVVIEVSAVLRAFYESDNY